MRGSIAEKLFVGRLGGGHGKSDDLEKNRSQGRTIRLLFGKKTVPRQKVCIKEGREGTLQEEKVKI